VEEIIHACHIAMSLTAKVSVYKVNSLYLKFWYLSKPFTEWPLVV